MYPTRLTAARSLIVALAGSLAAVFVSACSSPGSSPVQAAVPWISRPGVPVFNLASNAAADRVCLARDIHVEVGKTGAYQGHQTQELFVRNVAPDACKITAPPPVDIVFASGKQVAVGRSSSMSAVGASGGIDGLAPKAAVHVLVGTPATCAGAGGNPNIARIVKFSLSETEVVTVAATWINVECGSPVILAFDLAQPAGPPIPASSLTAKLNIQGSTSPGGTLTYLVTLSNPSPKAIALDPCPSYTESIGYKTPFQQTFLLNCAAVGSIPAGGSLTFEMRL